MVLTTSHVTQEVCVFSLTLMERGLNILQEQSITMFSYNVHSYNVLFPVAG